MTDQPIRVTRTLIQTLDALLCCPQADCYAYALSMWSGVSIPTTINILARLEEYGWLTSERVPNPTAGLPHRRIYRFVDDGRALAEDLVEPRKDIVRE